MQASVQLAGEITVINDEPSICINLRGNWKWRPLNQISAKSFATHKTNISKQVFNLFQDKKLTDKEASIHISNSKTTSADNINGIWVCKSPQVLQHQEYNVYKKTAIGNLWLYCVRLPPAHEQQPTDDDTAYRYQWWIGTKENKDIRKAWGFFRQKTATLSSIPPWEVTEWLSYNNPHGTTGSWRQESVKVCVMNQEYKYQMKLDIFLEDYQRSLKNSTVLLGKHMKISAELFNNLSKEQRLSLIDTSKFRAIFKKKDLCSCCFGSKPTTKCIHTDCTGACEDCRGNTEDGGNTEDEECCACGKQQIMECPICQTDFQPSFMKIFNCKHGICWKCNSMSWEVAKPVKKCPLCRVSITENGQ